MKKYLRTLSILCLVVSTMMANAQCGAGYVSATLNWDVLDYYYNSGSNAAPYGFTGGNYVSNAMEQSQKFSIGTTSVQIDVSAPGVVKGENGTQTSDITNYTGNDAQFTPGALGQTITLTFDDDVKNLSFTLYDVDALASLNFSAKNIANAPQTMTAATQGGTVLAVTGSGTTAMTISTVNATNQANNSNAGTVTVTVAGPVNQVTITVGILGTDPTFWLSDILACTPGSFPTNYHQIAANKPVTGQPDYFLVTPDNNSVYMVDPVSGKAYWVFSEVIAGVPFVNSLAYDPVKHFLYYVTDGTGSPSSNKQLKMYDFNTDTKSVLMADISTGLNIPLFDQGVESAAAAFYNGFLYIGVEGGRFNSSNTRETIIYKCTLNAAGMPTDAAQVYSTPAYNAGGTSVHDWGDFLVKDGKIIDFNTARQGGGPYTYPQSSYVHYDMLTGQIVNTYMNPGTAAYTGQAGMDWAGNLYTVRNTIEKYNGAGAITGAAVTITTGRGPAWVGNAGDASEPFRPKMDFGDSPASYDPAASPATHEMDSSLRLGAGFDREWSTKGQTALANSDLFDDGIAYVPTFNALGVSYLTQASVFNNSGAPATVCAWVDFNGNGVFDASEGITQTVNSSASAQTIWLYWPFVSTTLTNGSYTYMRIRVTSQANGMTTANATGFYRNGEVEDYRVPVNTYPLAIESHDFSAQLSSSQSVKLTWNSTDESNTASYVIERSANGNDWQLLAGAEVKNGQATVNYESTDNHPLAAVSYYRLKILRKDGTMKISQVERIDNRNERFSLNVVPNPAINKATVYINSTEAASNPATVEVISAQGVVVHSEKMKIVKGTNALVLPVATKLSSGRYIVRVTTDQNSYSQSLIINK